MFARRKERSFVCHYSCFRRKDGFYRPRNRSKVFHTRRAKVCFSVLSLILFKLIRASTAEVTIHIKNQGEEAYKPKEYGKTIIITRKWSKEGSTSWKIKNKEGRVISSKKDELAAICDHMNIQVDNPMNVLTQGTWPRFLDVGHTYCLFRCRQTISECIFSARQI